MKLYEYQARQLLADANIPVPGGATVTNADEARAAYENLAANGATLAVVKAQVHAGGRGKGGGVKLVNSAQEAFDVTGPMMDKPLITHQTGPEGVPVNIVMVAAGVDIEKEYYVSVTLDRASGAPVMIASSEGGVEIENVAENNPEAILKQSIHPLTGLAGHQARSLAFKLGFTGKQIGQATNIFIKLAKLFVDSDADMVEINPLIVTPASEAAPDGTLLAIDAKITIDDNALFRHKALAALDDGTETPESEREAQKHDLNFIQLDGTIGCLVNGAGLAMATMDIIKLHGAEPANFLDVGGSASEEAVTEAFRIILKDEKVKGVLVNIFGGIMQCDIIARAIVAAANNIGFDVPLVVRLEGSNVEAARKIIEAAQSEIPNMQTATDLTDAAKKITAAVNG